MLMTNENYSQGPEPLHPMHKEGWFCRGARNGMPGQWRIVSSHFFYNFESIMKDKVLKPGMGPLDDGTVNYTCNPNFHRFGAIRLVFDSSIKDRLIPMCYVRGEDMAILSNAVSRREHESNFEIPSNRIQNREFAAEPWLYKDECKWLSKDEMSLNG